MHALEGVEAVPFAAQTPFSVVRFGTNESHKCAVDSIRKAHPAAEGSPAAAELRRVTDEIGRAGGTPLAVIRDGRLLGAINLKDIVKTGIRERFAELRRMGIRTIMITGDNPLTAAAIAAEASSEEHTSELQSLMRTSYAVFCLKKKNKI